jgi:protein TonB
MARSLPGSIRRIMKAMALRSGEPGVRLGLALAASLVLHGAILFPPGATRLPHDAASRPPAVPSASLHATLTAPALATQPEEGAAPVEEPAVESPTAVPPAPTFGEARPKPLTGRALDLAYAALTSEEFYPGEAIERGLEGRVVLLLRLDAAGTVTAVEVASSSGHALLDAAAVQAAGRIGALPGGGRQVLLPVDFMLD